MKNTYLLVILVLLVGGGFYVLSMNKPQDKASSTSELTEVVEESTMPVPTEKTVVEISYTDEGFTPKSIEIMVGQTVRFMNNSSADMWVASAPHPTHDAYEGFDQLEGTIPGTQYTFTFDKVGTWKFHNHLSPTMFGEVAVTETPEVDEMVVEVETDTSVEVTQ